MTRASSDRVKNVTSPQIAITRTKKRKGGTTSLDPDTKVQRPPSISAFLLSNVRWRETSAVTPSLWSTVPFFRKFARGANKGSPRSGKGGRDGGRNDRNPYIPTHSAIDRFSQKSNAVSNLSNPFPLFFTFAGRFRSSKRVHFPLPIFFFSLASVMQKHPFYYRNGLESPRG